MVERATAAETAALSPNSFVNFAIPLPVADAAPAAPANEVRSMNTPDFVQSAQFIEPRPEPEAAHKPASEYDLLVEIEPLALQVESLAQPPAQQVELPPPTEAVPPPAEQQDIVAIALAVANPPSNTSTQSITNSRSQVTISDGDANSLSASTSRMSPVSDNDRQRLKVIVKKVDEAIAYSKTDPLADITDDEDLAIIRRLRKRGPNQLLTPLGKELLSLVRDKDAAYWARKRVFTLLTKRSINFWKKSGPIQAMLSDNNNNV
jgi:hypothetical protein